MGRTVQPAAPEHYGAFLEIYNQAFLSKMGFISSRKDRQLSLADDLGFIDFEREGTHFVALEDGEVLGILILKNAGSREVFKPKLSLPGILRKYGLGGVLRGLVLWILLEHKPEEDELYVESLGVSPAARGKGVGTLLLSFADQRAKQGPYRKLSLHVMLENPRAAALYEKVGYKTQALIKFRWLKKRTGYSGCRYMIKYPPTDASEEMKGLFLL